MYIQERDAYAHAHHGTPGYLRAMLWLAWVAVNFFALVLGQTAAQAVEEVISPAATQLPRALSLEGFVAAGSQIDVVAAIVGALLSGMALAIGQAIVLLPYLKLRGTAEWIPATLVGRAIGWIAVYIMGKSLAGLVVDRTIAGMLELFILLGGTAIISGGALGYAQAIVWRRRVIHPGWWVLANLVGPLATAAAIEVTLLAETQNTIRDATTAFMALIGAATTGIALLDLLGSPTTQAEWKNERWRKEALPAPQQEATVLGSTLYTPKHPHEPAQPTTPKQL